MRAVLVCAVAAATLVAAGCGGASKTSRAAKAFVESAERNLGATEPAVTAAVNRYRRCAVLETTAPLDRRAAIDTEAQGISVFVSLHSLPTRYHRFRTELDAVDTDDPGLLRARAAVRTIDAKLRGRNYPALDVCAFLRDWKAANWEQTQRFESSWFARHGYKAGNGLGPRFGVPVRAVATKALLAAGAAPLEAARFTQLAEVYIASG